MSFNSITRSNSSTIDLKQNHSNEAKEALHTNITNRIHKENIPNGEHEQPTFSQECLDVTLNNDAPPPYAQIHASHCNSSPTNTSSHHNDTSYNNQTSPQQFQSVKLQTPNNQSASFHMPNDRASEYEHIHFGCASTPPVQPGTLADAETDAV